MSKKLITITIAAGVVSFAGAFATGWFTQPAAVMGSVDPNRVGPVGQAQTPVPPQVLTLTVPPAEESTGTRAITEQQLKELVFEVQEKIQEYDRKLESLEREEDRLRIAQQTLMRDIETLNNLRVDLAATAASVKSERDLLRKARVEVEQVEKTNLIAIAAAYDKMDSASAAEILTNMAMGQSKNGNGSRSATINDAVKILHFMQERTKAKVLAELASTEPALAALLCQKLKQVQAGK